MSNVPAVNELQAKLTTVMEELDHKVFRPQQVRRLALVVPASRATIAVDPRDRAPACPPSRSPSPLPSPGPIGRKPRFCARRSART
jgi:hypothetical protein